MDVDEINQELQETRRELGTVKRVNLEYELLKEYRGPDRVVSSKEKNAEIEERKANEPKDINFFSGFPTLDELLKYGWRPGHIIVVSGPTGHGKTHFCQSLTINLAEKGLNPIWFSYEVDEEEFFERFNGDIPHFYLPNKIIEENLAWVEQRIKEAKAKHNSKVVFIDTFHDLVSLKDLSKISSTSIFFGLLMGEIKRMAREQEVAIFILAHFRKTWADQDEERLPDNDDIRDSSFITQKANMVLLIKRKFQDKKPTPYATLKVSKNRRSGKLGNVKLEMIGNRFVEYSDVMKSDEQIQNWLDFDKTKPETL